MKKEPFFIWLYVAAFAVAYFIFYKANERNRYYEGVKKLGFGEFWLDQMTTKELKAFYIYIYEFTQKGKMPEFGSTLDFQLIAISKKFPAILNYK
jgi:hypothetical protein